MRTIAFATAISLLISACATTENFEKILATWVGTHVDNLVSQWGPPARSYPLSDGGSVLEYTNQRNIQIGGYATSVPQTTYNSGSVNVSGTGGSAYGTYSGTTTTYVQQTTPVQNIAMQCITRFTVNGSGTITKWAWQGNDCRATEPKQQVRATAAIPQTDLKCFVECKDSGKPLESCRRQCATN